MAALPHRSGPAPRLDAPARDALRACLRQQPDATLDELRTWLAALGGPAVSPVDTLAGGAGAGLAAKKERPRRRARHRAGSSPAPAPLWKPCKPKILPVLSSWTRPAPT
ncbi:MAG: helix-turn-helix domain-containing protein [Hymenobacter sp.]